MSFADDVLDGMFCQVCGEAMISEDDDEACGFPTTCAGCGGDDSEEE